MKVITVFIVCFAFGVAFCTHRYAGEFSVDPFDGINRRHKGYNRRGNPGDKDVEAPFRHRGPYYSHSMPKSRYSTSGRHDVNTRGRSGRKRHPDGVEPGYGSYYNKDVYEQKYRVDDSKRKYNGDSSSVKRRYYGKKKGRNNVGAKRVAERQRASDMKHSRKNKKKSNAGSNRREHKWHRESKQSRRAGDSYGWKHAAPKHPRLFAPPSDNFGRKEKNTRFTKGDDRDKDDMGYRYGEFLDHDFGLDFGDNFFDEFDDRITGDSRRMKPRYPRREWMYWYHFSPPRGFLHRHSRYNPEAFWLTRPGLGKPEVNWWEGPNVCVRRKEKVKESSLNGTWISHHYSVTSQICDMSRAMYKCTTRTEANGEIREVTVIRECCDGTSHSNKLRSCVAQAPLSNLTTTAIGQNLTEFLRAAHSVGLRDSLDLKNLTLFVPENDKLDAYTNLLMPADEQDLESMPPLTNVVLMKPSKADQLVSNMRHFVLGHIIPDVHKTSDFSDEMVLKTSSPIGSSIRVNLYEQPRKTITVNCVRVVRSDILATNGVIHVIDNALTPVTDTITDLVSKNQQLTYTKKMLGKTGWSGKLRGPGQFTLFAPTDAAFKKLNTTTISRLFNQPSCLKKVINGLLLPNVICSTVVKNRARTKNILGNYVKFREAEGKIWMEGAAITQRDNMATNGVLHSIDTVIIPEDAMDVIGVAERNNAALFRRLINKSGLSGWLREAENVTLLAPSDDAFKALGKEELQKLESDPKALKAFVRYHFVTSTIDPSNMALNMNLQTLQENQTIRMCKYENYDSFSSSEILTAQCARVIKRDLPSCTAPVYILDKVMLPARGSVMSLLESDPRFARFTSLLKDHNLDKLIDGAIYTVLAPTDEAFNTFPETFYANKRRVLALLKNHIVPGQLCCAGISSQGWRLWAPAVRTLSGTTLRLSRDAKNMPAIGNVAIKSCDTMATNGLIHAVDKLVIARPRPKWSFLWNKMRY